MDLTTKEGYFEVWSLIENGEIPPTSENLWGIGKVYGIEYSVIQEIIENGNLRDHIEQHHIDPPKNAISTMLKVSELNHQDGQMTFPETGQWDFPPHWEMKIEIMRYEQWNESQKAIQEANR